MLQQFNSYCLITTEFVFFQTPENNSYSSGNNIGILHKRSLFGLIGSVGLKGFFSDKISYSTNLRYEYDINSADNLPYYSYTPGGSGPEGTTHNLRIGIELGLQYHFSIDNYRFDKSPHQL